MNHFTETSFCVLFVLTTASCDERAPSTNAQASDNSGHTPSWEQGVEKPATVGLIYKDLDFILEASTPRRCATAGPLGPSEGLIRVSVPIRIKALTNRSVPVGPLLFTVQDEQGHQYRATLAGCSPIFSPHEIRKSTETKAEIAFDVPHDARELQLLFEPFLVGRKKVEARVLIPELKKQ